MQGVFELAEALITPVHELRRTYQGIQHLEQTGRFKTYMQDFVDTKNRPFMSWDGEGWTDIDGEHRYMLLQCSNGDSISAPQLSTVECLDFMVKTATENPGVIHVIFGGGYDATHILRDLSNAKRLELKELGTVTFFAKDVNGKTTNKYKIEYIPHKWLQITGWNWLTRQNVTMKIYDVMTFFQSSFMNALASRQLEVPEVIKTGKANRSTFTYLDLDEISTYCQMELELLVMLCDKLRLEFQDAGVYVTQYHGPGAVASAVFKAQKVREHMQPPPLPVERALQRAYFGGRFEQFKAGHYDGKVYVYDINSAYPDKIRNLPSLAGSRYEYTDVYDGSLGVWFCSSDSGDAGDISGYPSPWRGTAGNVGFPRLNKGGWLWTFEAQHATTVHYGYKLILANDIKPFAFVEDMYLKRQQWKKEKRGGERALKLALNSLYGKMAQRVGGSDKYDGRPPWHQLDWAGMVTSATRAQLWEAISQAPESIIAVETDSVTSTVPLDLDIGPGLGQWEADEYDWITYVQSGIYFTSGDATGEKVKSRGIDVKELKHAAVLAYMDSDQSEPLLVPSRQFIGLTNPRTYLYGQWQDTAKEVRIAGAKRLHMTANCRACTAGLSMSKHLHDLTANPLYGLKESHLHPLPWLDGTDAKQQPGNEDLAKVSTEAIADWETSARHSAPVFEPIPEPVDKPKRKRYVKEYVKRNDGTMVQTYMRDTDPAEVPLPF